MPRVFVGNFDFEHELAGRGPLSAPLQELTDGLARVWLTILEPADHILRLGGDPAELKLDGLAPSFSLEPWGWTARMLRIAKQGRFAVHHPPLDVVQRVNTRSFRFRLEEELGLVLPGATTVESLDEAERFTARLPGRWVLKAAFGMAGREQWRGTGPIGSRGLAWVDRKLPEGPLVLEPWLEGLAEAGLQFDVPQSGSPVFLGATPQIVDARGTYRGSLFGAPEDDEPWREAVEIGREVAVHVQRHGYFGPLSLDAMRYREGDAIRIRPLQDLNARWSMGRLALGAKRYLTAGECGAWFHRPLGSVTPRVPDTRHAIGFTVQDGKTHGWETVVIAALRAEARAACTPR